MTGDNQNVILVAVAIAAILIIWQCSRRHDGSQEGFTVPGYDTCSPSIAMGRPCATPGGCASACDGDSYASAFNNSQQYGWEALDNTLFNAVYGNTSARAHGSGTSCASNCCQMCAAGMNGTSMAAGSCGYGPGRDM